MSLIVNIYYTGKNGSAKKFVDEMISEGIVEKIRAEEEILDMNISFQKMIQKRCYS